MRSGNLAPGNEYNLSTISILWYRYCSCISKEIKPGNLEFIQSDITNVIKFDDDYFDFVRMSLLAIFLQVDKWVRILRESLLTTSSSSNHHVSPSSRHVFSTLNSTNTLINTSSHQINQNLKHIMKVNKYSFRNTNSLIGSAQTGKVFEELLKSYFENTVVDLLPWYWKLVKINIWNYGINVTRNSKIVRAQQNYTNFGE
ncbi:14478_t:CDS:2 [Gigaspora rosea]|nr:14478_t:CDS:2 [Gigaspora rosea]